MALRYYIVQYEDPLAGWTDIPEWARKTEHACIRLMEGLGCPGLRVLRKPKGWAPEVEPSESLPATVRLDRRFADPAKHEMRMVQEEKHA